MSDLVIRAGTAGDLPSMIGLWRALEDAQAPFRIYPRVAEAESRAEQVLRDALADPDSRVFVAEAGGRLVGMATARLVDQGPRSMSDARAIELSRVVVAPDHRGGGIGAGLIDAAESFARERGAEWLEAKLFSGNDAGRGFWERLGFVPRYEQRVRKVAD